MNYKLFILSSIVSGFAVTSDQECLSYFNIVTGAEDLSYHAIKCTEAIKALNALKNVEGVQSLKVCNKTTCNQFGPLHISSVKNLLKQSSERE